MSNPNTTSLVIDLNRVANRGRRKGWDMYGCLILRPSVCKIQAYKSDVSLNLHEHGQLDDYELSDRINVLETSGFQKLTDSDLENGHRPEKFIIVMEGDKDYNLDEIQVFNNFHMHGDLMELVRQLELQAIAQHMLGKQWRHTKTLLNRRGNVQLSQGSNQVDMRNRTAFVGMNTANPHMKLKGIDGLEEGTSMDDTMFEKNVIVTRIFDRICAINGRTRPFNDSERSAPWAAKECLERGCEVDALRSDGRTWLYSGPLTERVNGLSTAKCLFHRDQNDDRKGATENVCISQVVELLLPGRSKTVQGRSALNQYMKGCNGSTFEKVQVNEKVWGRCVEYAQARGINLSEVGSASSVDWVDKLKRVREEVREGNGQVDFASIPADVCKDCHTSWYAQVILKEVVEEFGYDQHIIDEAIFARALTSSAAGWRKGVRYGLNACKRNSKNLITNFVNEMRAKHGAVSNGMNKKMRCQTSSGGAISKREVFMSINNLRLHTERANEADYDTEEMYNDMSKGPFANTGRHIGGIAKAGFLTLQDMVSISTKVGRIVDTRHVHSVSIAKGTKTYDRLVEDGVKNEKHLEELVRFICHKLGTGDKSIAENLLCEVYRVLIGGEDNQGFDTIGLNQSFYYVNGGVVRERDYLKQDCPVNFRSYKKKRGKYCYNPDVEWWNIAAENPARVLGDMDEDMILSQNSKLIAW